MHSCTLTNALGGGVGAIGAGGGVGVGRGTSSMHSCTLINARGGTLYVQSYIDKIMLAGAPSMCNQLYIDKCLGVGGGRGGGTQYVQLYIDKCIPQGEMVVCVTIFY